ncbi:MAG: 4-hydroxy-tetrahydrodipicolinate reductase, partial [Acidimicrobiales bacterium]
MATRVGVFGAGGRMGSTVCRAVAADPDLELVAGVDPLHAGIDLSKLTGAEVDGLSCSRDADALAEAGA